MPRLPRPRSPFVAADGDPNLRHCIFCFAPLTRKDISKEHLLARSWAQHFPTDRDGYTNFGWWVDELGEVQWRPDEDINVRPPFQTTVPVVCNACNNGWMGRLEEHTVPLLWDLSQGTQDELTVNEVALVTRWLAKTVAVLECNDHMRSTLREPWLRRVKSAGENAQVIPGNLAMWIVPIAPNARLRMRTSVDAVLLDHEGCDGHPYRASLIQVHQVGLLALYSGDDPAWRSLILPRISSIAKMPTNIPPKPLILDRDNAMTPDEFYNLGVGLLKRLTKTRPEPVPDWMTMF